MDVLLAGENEIRIFCKYFCTLLVCPVKLPKINIIFLFKLLSKFLIQDSKIAVLKNCGHFPFIEQPDNFFEILNTFLID